MPFLLFIMIMCRMQADKKKMMKSRETRNGDSTEIQFNTRNFCVRRSSYACSLSCSFIEGFLVKIFSMWCLSAEKYLWIRIFFDLTYLWWRILMCSAFLWDDVQKEETFFALTRNFMFIFAALVLINYT